MPAEPLIAVVLGAWVMVLIIGLRWLRRLGTAPAPSRAASGPTRGQPTPRTRHRRRPSPSSPVRSCPASSVRCPPDPGHTRHPTVRTGPPGSGHPLPCLAVRQIA